MPIPSAAHSLRTARDSRLNAACKHVQTLHSNLRETAHAGAAEHPGLHESVSTNGMSRPNSGVSELLLLLQP